MTKNIGLGKGLSALLENSDTDITSKYTNNNLDKVVGSVALIPLDQIEVNPFQPRTAFDGEQLEGLKTSIEENGLIQPVTVRKLGYDRYQLISGERRLRASQLAGLKEIPAYIRVANDQAMLEMALVENIQREELDAIEIAISYQRLIEECALTQEKLSKKVGKNRTTITNYLRLLKLPPDIQLGIKEGKLTMGHARALINAGDERKQLEIYQQILLHELSVRDVEHQVRSTGSKGKEKKFTALPPPYQRVKEALSSHFGTKIDLKRTNNGSGKIEIPFHSDEEFQRIVDALKFQEHI